MTFSPPAKVKNEPSGNYRILASGIDSLYLTLNVHWASDEFFNYLAELKEQAKQSDSPVSGKLTAQNQKDEWHFQIRKHGSGGYEWILVGKELTFDIGNWLVPIGRPSVKVKISSEALWRIGVKECLSAIRVLIEGHGASQIVIKPSRVDLCVDLLMPDAEWEAELVKLKVTRAQHAAVYYEGKVTTGLVVGKGKISARNYDKAFEIEKKSKKYWMYDIWGIEKVPEHMRAIRVEFQLRRELLKELGVKGIQDLFDLHESVWAYCTQKWLKFRSRPGLHHTQRKTLGFWMIVQDGYQGAQGATPAIREKAFAPDRDMLARQVWGGMTSLMAATVEEYGLSRDYVPKIEDGYEAIIRAMYRVGEDEKEYGDKVNQKRAKYARLRPKYKQTGGENGTEK